MKTDTHFCDVCGRELKTVAIVKSKAENIIGGFHGAMKDDYNAEIKITLNKIAGAYSVFCSECTQDILEKAVVFYGEIGGTLKLIEEEIK